MGEDGGSGGGDGLLIWISFPVTPRSPQRSPVARAGFPVSLRRSVTYRSGIMEWLVPFCTCQDQNVVSRQLLWNVGSGFPVWMQAFCVSRSGSGVWRRVLGVAKNVFPDPSQPFYAARSSRDLCRRLYPVGFEVFVASGPPAGSSMPGTSSLEPPSVLSLIHI